MINEIQEKIQEIAAEKAAIFFKTKKKGHINAAMRFGKIFCTIKILNKLYKVSPKILLCYPDNKLKEAWIQDFEKWGYNYENIVFCNFSSLKKYSDSTFDFFIVDEWHSLSENELNLAKNISNLCFKTLALSGTVSKETQQKWVELEEIYKYTTEQGISDLILSDYQISVHLVNLDKKIFTPNKKGKMLSEKNKYDNYSYVIKSMQSKRKPFMHLALARNRLSLSSIGKIEYTKKLLKKLTSKRVLVFTGLASVADSLDIQSYHSKSESDGHFLAFKDGVINQLALAAMGKVGVTYPSLDSVILLNFTYNAEESSQILNRCIKLDYKDKLADMHVICLNEPAEIKKVKESLSMLDQSKIKYV